MPCNVLFLLALFLFLLLVVLFAFSALKLLAGRQEEHPAWPVKID